MFCWWFHWVLCGQHNPINQVARLEHHLPDRLVPNKALDRSEGGPLSFVGKTVTILTRSGLRSWHPTEQGCAGTPNTALSEWDQQLESIQALHMQVWKLQFVTLLQWLCLWTLNLKLSRHVYHALLCRHIPIKCFIFFDQGKIHTEAGDGSF